MPSLENRGGAGYKGETGRNRGGGLEDKEIEGTEEGQREIEGTEEGVWRTKIN